MIQFSVKLDNGQVKKIPSKYPDLIKYEANFKILIDNKLFFEDPNFPLLDFLNYANKWKKQQHFPFEYNSLETEDNPLIAFSCKNEKWYIISPWQYFHCTSSFTTEEILFALNMLQKTVISST